MSPNSDLVITVCPAADLSAADRADIIALCSLAYEEDAEPWITPLVDPVHVIGRIDGRMVSHAAWVERWLQPEGLEPLRTAYIEAVATHPDAQRRGLASRIMAALPALLGNFELGGLAPSDAGFYAQLGWESWLGPLSVRTPEGLVASEGEEAMILRLPRTPALDLTVGLSIEGRDGEVW